MFSYEKVLFSRLPIAQANLSFTVNDVNSGSPSRMRRVLLISFGMTILPKSSTRRTMPVAFIVFPLLVQLFQWYCLQEMGYYAVISGWEGNILRLWDIWGLPVM